MQVDITIMSQTLPQESILPEPTGGKAIPTNAFDLMKALRSQERGDAAQDRQQQVLNRKRKQDIRKETVERQLMAGEDYTFTEEGARRLKAMEERITMEGEDILSLHMNKRVREENALKFRLDVRRDAEARKRQEEVEQEQKRVAAQKRRDAIVDRIRKKQEAEEMRAREAASAKLKELMSQKKLEEEAAELLRANQATMILEDELSAIAEQLHQEREQQRAWLRKEAVKLAEWEQAQQEQDEQEAQSRKQKLLDLEEKKKKLAELRKSQGGDGVETRRSELSAARSEALKLSKQQRMQNKAKFVSRRRKDKMASQKDLFSGSMQLPPPESSAPSMFSSTFAGLSNISQEKIDTEEKSEEEAAQACDMSKYEALETEIQLHCALKELMAEKRGLRLQLMQTKSAEMSSEAISVVKEVKLRIKQISEIGDYIACRVDKLVQKKSEVNGQEESDNVALAAPINNLVLTRTASSKGSAQDASVSRRRSSSVISLHVISNVYHDIETTLRETRELLLKAEVVGLFTKLSDMSADERDALMRKAGLLRMKTTDFIVKVKHNGEDDINGYENKLTESLNKLQLFLDKDAFPTAPSLHGDGAAATKEPQSLPILGSSDTTLTLNSCEHDTVVVSAPATLLTSESGGNIKIASTKWEDVKKKGLLDPGVHPPEVRMIPVIHSDTALSATTKDEPELGVDTIQEKSLVAVHNSLALSGSVDLDNTGDVLTECVNVEEEENKIEDEIDYESIEGWNESLHTTMATAAHHAAFYGFTQVLELLSRFFDVFTMDSNQRTPLFYASLRNNFDCVLLLVAIDPQWIEVGDVKGETCMHAAVKANGVEVLQFLLTCDVESSIANNEGLTPAHLAKSFPLLSALHEAGSTLYCVDSRSRMPLWYACRDGLKENVELLCSVMPPEYITWQDDEGNSPLHIACMFGQSEVVEVISTWLAKLEDFYLLNKKHYSPAHVATSADVLRRLYEFGVDLWVPDPKGRYPLFINSFQGRVDCVTLLIEFGVAKNKKLVCAKDKQGDSALHAACMCGHFGCVVLLLYWLDNDPNKQGLTPHALAVRTKHSQIASLVEYVEGRKTSGEQSESIFQCSFDKLAAMTLAHGSRWTKLYDHSNDSVYYYDRVLLSSQWDRPQTFDEDVACEAEMDSTRDILRRFYSFHNPEKLSTINDILHVYKGNFSDLYVQLAERYQVQDLSIFYQ